MKIKAISLILLLFPFNSIAENYSYQMQTQPHNGKEIHYYLIQKGTAKSKNLLVLIQGSDCKSVVNNPDMVKNFGAAFPNNDILLVEKTGLTDQIGQNNEEVEQDNCPVEYMKNDSPLERAENYISVLNQLKDHYQQIILLGGSEGAVVTNIIVSKVDYIKASIALNLGGRYFIDDVIYSIKNNTPAEYVSESVDGFKQFAQAAKDKQLDENQFVSSHGPTWWYESLTIDNQNLIQSIKTPHLVIQTMVDINVDAHNAQRMMKNNTNTKVSFKSYEGLDHFFKDDKGKSQTSMIVTDIQSWYQSINH
ncbi:MAG TPA: alpha/beta hydrolase [Providencia sp.]|uniref:alpha/beta hydrolase n=1 Tax=Providencia sp. TaxID=589 RepID=UPI000E8A18A2|nr:alpha/beta hydrolase [Providencia sp.]MBP6081937.1 alpha/beta hydrolase [Providencia sp.]HBO21979.1 alpha/beta hydrolase [Providencia sp.]